ncbi:hypothetical protein [Rouxiella badensis]|uniref:Uncharacterized protein n=1 Tax=Rouxiella badensis TaxID=1646377 RepID=A0A1X0WI51_9GAMM|nr:hypothetical protein [Rouxiella badensis]MCC3703316.1 hypothetical protein [Rouxiella badensis]MCC3718255.1 hypothetical protein [Rouxiella badensis]MCC3726977.1 hypothetical protein [Rouxiella badensis]MCC3731739.1 hypothetical protein [Rouxiella badensis]MCC3738674.1 hypothetical protein [Rouxiella badensis]
MYISSQVQRRTVSVQENDGDSHSSDEEDKRRFASLLASISPRVVPASVTSRLGCSSGSAGGFTLARGADTLMLKQLTLPKYASRDAWLSWRLTNGALAGLEIEARSSENGLFIRLKAVDHQKLIRILGSAKRLQQRLIRQFEKDIQVEVSDEDPAIK